MNFSECPQNIFVPSLASRHFRVEIHQSFGIPKASSDRRGGDDVMLFIDAILSDLMDALGDTFRVSIVRTTKHLVLSISMPKQLWLYDMAMKMSEFQAGLNTFSVSVDIDNSGGVWQWSSNENEFPRITYRLVAKDGIYVEKMRETVTRTMKEAPTTFSIMLGGSQEVKYPSYETEYTRF
jgi:hypothetical protein